jgi:nitroreductase
MDTHDAIRARVSVREFAGEGLPQDTIKRIVDAGRQAPTARGEEPWEFVVVTKRPTLERIAGLTDHGKFIGQAAACVVVVCRDTKYYLEDGCAATENMLIAAADLGAGSCWVAGDKKPYAKAICAALGVPEGYRLVSMIALGWPKARPKPPHKRSLGEVSHWEKF